MPPTTALPDSSAPKKTFGHPSMQPKQTSTPIHELELLFSPVEPHATTPAIHLRPSTDRDRDAVSAVPQRGETEDEYTLSAYGDISLSDIVVPPLPAPTPPSPLESRFPQPRLRLKVRRPPLPKRRLSYAYTPDPLPLTGGLDPEDHWPRSPRPLITRPPWRPLVPLPATPGAKRRAGDGRSSLEKLFDALVPRSPSIRLSPPGSPANPAQALPRETKSGARQDATRAPQPAVVSTPAPAPRQEKPWRTRLPPRLPIPKWDM